MTLKDAKERSIDHGEYPLFFTTMVGLDFRLKSQPKYYAKANEPRCVIIQISSFIGACGGAKHYYATIVANGIMICSDKQTEKGIVTTIHGGYLGEEFEKMPKHKRDLYSFQYKIEVCRELTEKEISDDPLRWKGCYPGSRTVAFNSEYSAIRAAQAIVKARFSNLWNVKIEKV